MATVQIANGDILQVRFVAHCRDQVGQFIRHYGIDTLVGILYLEDVAASLSASIGPLITPLMNNQAFYQGAMVRRIYPVPLSIEVEDNSASGNGTAGVQALPLQVSGIITLRTILAGRTHRGRAYIPFPAEDSNEGEGIPTVGYAANLETLGDKLDDTLTAGTVPNTCDLVPLIFHRSNPANPTNIVAHTTRRRWATQRRRGSYGQTNPL